MRDIVLVLAILAGLGLTLRWPFVGVLLGRGSPVCSPMRKHLVLLRQHR